MGMCPVESAAGDRIIVWLGAKMPYFIRKVDDDVFALVGECYIFGAMDGEAMRDASAVEMFSLH